MNILIKTTGAALLALSVHSNVANAGPPSNGSEEYVTKAEYDKLKQEMKELRALVKTLTKQGAAPAQGEPTQTNQEISKLNAEVATLKEQVDAAPPEATKEEISKLNEEVVTLKEQADTSRSGTTKFLLTGYAFAGFSDSNASHSSFNAGFFPIFLWRLSDNILFEGEVEFELEDTETEVNLEYAQISYLFNDYITLGAGKFLNPGNYFIERLHPAWINKLPDRPLSMVGDTRIQANSQLGFQVRGGVPLGSMRGEYAFYVSNGPRMRPDGTLSFSNFEDNNDNKAVGGHIGWLPIPGFEVGYGFEVGKANDPIGDGLSYTTHAVDLNYTRIHQLIRGSIDLRFQAAWRDIDRSRIPLLAFNNNSSGGYVQLAYRPSLSGIRFLKDLEPVVRYDWIDLPVGFTDESRWTLGLAYYLAPSTLVKFAYEFDHRHLADDNDALFFQIATGF